MAPADQKTEVVLPAEVLEEMPLPSDRRLTFLGGLATDPRATLVSVLIREILVTEQY
jgi:hypothetical protein